MLFFVSVFLLILSILGKLKVWLEAWRFHLKKQPILKHAYLCDKDRIRYTFVHFPNFHLASLSAYGLAVATTLTRLYVYIYIIFQR
jgi:hypothetical protein